VDVEDCATVSRALIAEGLADPARISIRGASAGGWTALWSAIARPDLYRAAGCYFPVLDPATWRAGGTHDFEARYADALIGPWPQSRARYEERSPVRWADQLSVPVALFQGGMDRICPPAQAAGLVDRLRQAGIPHTYLLFDGERHGFRRRDTIIRCLEAELACYGKAMGFLPDPPDLPDAECGPDASLPDPHGRADGGRGVAAGQEAQLTRGDDGGDAGHVTDLHGLQSG
jgi:dipeptidyl aminopeptidase/acylaminoacyl peptidase